MTRARENWDAVNGATAASMSPSRRWTWKSSGARMVVRVRGSPDAIASETRDAAKMDERCRPETSGPRTARIGATRARCGALRRTRPDLRALSSRVDTRRIESTWRNTYGATKRCCRSPRV
jgi:hypothetical protein